MAVVYSAAVAPAVNPGSSAPLPHDSLQSNIGICALLTWLVAAVFVVLRVYTRGFVVRIFSWEDGCLILSLGFSAALSASQVDEAIHGVGMHIWDIPATSWPGIQWAQWYGLLSYWLTLAFCKISIILLYLSIFTTRRIRMAGLMVLAIVIVTSAWTVAGVLTICIPLQAYWDFTIKNPRCWPAEYWWGNMSLHLATDYMIFFLPMPVIWRLNVPRKQKVVLVGIFALGFFVCLISVVRLVFLIKGFANPPVDLTYNSAVIAYWTAVEVNLAIVCACLMTLQPLVTRFFPRLISNGDSEASKSQVKS